MQKFRPLLKLFAALAGLIFVAAFILLVRLSMGPLSVTFLAPYLKEALLFDRQDLSLSFDDAALALEGFNGSRHSLPAIKIRLNNVRVFDRDHKQLLTLPSGAVALSIAGLLRGKIAPSSIEIDKPALYVNWRGGDIFGDFGAGNADHMLEDLPLTVEKASIELLPFFIRELASPADYSSSAGYLQRIRIAHATLILHEQDSGSRWTFPDAELDLARGENGVKLNADGILKKAGMKNAQLTLTGNYDRRLKETALRINFRNLNPAAFAGASQSMVALRAVDMPLDGVFYANLQAGRRITSAGFAVISGAGNLVLPKYYPKPVHFDKIIAVGKYDRLAKEFALKKLSLQFGQAHFDGDGLIYAGNPGPGFRINGDIKDLPLTALKEYWPQRLATGGYDWVSENITGGVATEGHLHLDITPAMRNLPTLPAAAVDFRFQFKDVEAHYLRPMPPITDGLGFATLNPKRFDLTVTSGRVAGVKITRSQMSFSDLDFPDKTMAAVSADFAGSLSPTLTLIDHEPLGYPSQYGLKPASVSGASRIHLKLAFPLKRSIRLKDVDFDVVANLQNMAIPKLYDSLGMDQGTLKMHVDRKGIDTSGKIALNGVPFDFTWKEDFADNVEYSSRYGLKAPLTGDQWAALHLPVGDYVKGPALLDVMLTGKGPHIMGGTGTLDLTASAITLSRLGWAKPLGDKALMRFSLIRNGEGLDIPDIAYRDNHLQLDASLSLGPEDEILAAFLTKFHYGETSLSAKLKRQGAAYDISLDASHFDARPMLKDLNKHSKNQPELSLPDFNLKASVDHLMARNGVTLRHVTAEAQYRNNLYRKLKVDGKISAASGLSFAIMPAGDNAAAADRKLKITTGDAGALASGFGLFRNISGGTLKVEADLSGIGKAQQVKGAVVAENFKVIKSPVLGDIISKGGDIIAKGPKPPKGNVLKADDISFEALDLPFIYQNGAILVKPARAYGPSMGVTMEGAIDLQYNSLVLNGTIVPAYTLNSILRWMPVVGNLLMGGKGKGLFALTYKVTGPVADPKVDVNKLAVLAPGFLRGIVEVFEGAGATVSPERKAAELKAARDKAKTKKPAPQDGE